MCKAQHNASALRLLQQASARPTTHNNDFGDLMAAKGLCKAGAASAAHYRGRHGRYAATGCRHGCWRVGGGRIQHQLLLLLSLLSPLLLRCVCL